VPTTTASDWRWLRDFGVCVRVYGSEGRCGATRRDIARGARSGPKHFKVARFDPVFLQILELNCQECQLGKL
jgi:hypothetical protein